MLALKIGMMRSQAKEYQLEEAGKGLPTESAEGAGPYRHLDFVPGTLISDFWPPELGEKKISTGQSQPVCGKLLQQPQETNTGCN